MRCLIRPVHSECLQVSLHILLIYLCPCLVLNRHSINVGLLLLYLVDTTFNMHDDECLKCHKRESTSALKANCGFLSLLRSCTNFSYLSPGFLKSECVSVIPQAFTLSGPPHSCIPTPPPPRSPTNSSADSPWVCI